ncbi:MAG: RagB/SusD family nutrient uptake outer membrane protein [Bacteroidales bacterium]|nr:RagB/SusD family nutrient uptake outer membrane protein [Bacteroidales bacterium]
MKLKRFFFTILAGLALVACSDIDSVVPESGTMLTSQVQETNVIAPSRAEASFAGMFTNIGLPDLMYTTPDDWQFLMINFCNDLEGADCLMPDSNYNWFSVCGEYSSRNANYRNPYIRYRAPYNMIANANTFIGNYDLETADDHAKNMIAQAYALRAYSYLSLAPSFQFGYSVAADQPCVPIMDETIEDVTNNPRATVREIYNRAVEYLDFAINILDNTPEKRASKMYIDKNVAHGLRARAYLAMGEWAKALADAQAAAQGYTPASIEELRVPAFYNIEEHNWIWGYDMTVSSAARNSYATTSSWLRSFSGDGYAPATQCYCMINTMLYDLIPDTDVRKGWWVDEDLYSPLIEGMTWPGCTPPDVAHASDGGDTKLPFLPYTNVKFGCFTVGTTVNDEDTPLMRVEEMILIQAECQANLGQEAAARTTLENFVKTYRDPSYSSTATSRTLLDEIWFQRRVELWGEGFFVPDARRLNKPIVRFHTADGTNMPTAFRFNIAADDPWLLMRFPQGEMNTNFGIVDNTGGNMPVVDQNPGLRDGVTD